MIGVQPFITSINMGLVNTTNDCIAYINKLKNMAGTNTNSVTQIVIRSQASYGNTNYIFDDVNDSGSGDEGYVARQGVLEANPGASVTYTNGADYHSSAYRYLHLLNGSNIAGYLCYGAHSSLYDSYATNGYVSWTGNSGWWLIETIESFNGRRTNDGSSQAYFLQWFASNAFGGSNYSNTPVGAVSHVHEPGGDGWNKPNEYFGLWESGNNFGMCAWISRRTPYLQAVGDPLTRK